MAETNIGATAFSPVEPLSAIADVESWIVGLPSSEIVPWKGLSGAVSLARRFAAGWGTAAAASGPSTRCSFLFYL